MLVFIFLCMVYMFFSVFFSFNFSLLISFLFIFFVYLLTILKMEYSLWSFCSFYFSGSNFSVVMVCLSCWISILMFMVSMKYYYFNKVFNSFSFSVLSLLLVVSVFFSVDNWVLLYIMFELSLLPTLLLILKWGYQPERLQSGFYFVMYTVCASLPLLYMISSMSYYLFSLSMMTVNPFIVVSKSSSIFFFYVSFIMAFLVKLPMWGFHLWLPKAHVEAPVSGSMILAGVLLKLGGYGLVNILLSIYKLNSFSLYFIYSVNLWGAFMVGLVCLCSVDIKILIAYSSVIHMNMLIVSVLSYSWIGVLGALMMMVAHGLSSSGMFCLANFNYEMVNSRNLLVHKGISMFQPNINFFWFLFISANMSAPPSLNLISELFICVSVLKMSFIFFFICGVIVFISGGYNLYLYSSQQGNFSFFLCPVSNSFSVMYLSGVLHLFPMGVFVFVLNSMF